jgi:hypothetical protein
MSRHRLLSRLCFAISFALLAIAVLAAAVKAAAPAAAGGFSQRAELWNFYQWNDTGSAQNKILFRFYQDIGLGGDWAVTLRQDIPLLLTDKVGTENPEGDWTSGLGDAFIQFVFATPEILPRTRLHAGMRVQFPTGQHSPFSAETYQLGPMAAISYRLEDVLHGITLAPTARYMMSVAKTEASAVEVRQLQVYPRMTVGLSDRWALLFWDDEPIVWDHETDEWFVPFDGMVTYEFAPGATLKFGGSVPMTSNTSTYTHMVYGSLSFRF